MDCVNLVMPGRFELPVGNREARLRRELPLAEELLGGVAGFLKEAVASDASPRVEFLSRVAQNALAIVQRELVLGPGLAKQERQRLASLLGDDGELLDLRWQLVLALRGDLALDTPGLPEHLRQTVAGQLAVDQPRYGALCIAQQHTNYLDIAHD